MQEPWLSLPGDRAAGPRARRLRLPSENPWWVIVTVGGLCWLVVALIAILWALPYSGTVLEGQYVATGWARAVQYFFVFALAACAYRASIRIGWPVTLPGRAAAIFVNLLLAAAVVRLAPIALAVAVGLVDQRPDDVRETLHLWRPFAADWMSWTTVLRFFLPPYALGIVAVALVLVVRRNHQESLRSAEFARAYAAARLATLSAQLQPHFLFNALHATVELIDESPDKAKEMIARLGDFLRHAVESTHSPWIDVRTELVGLEAYLAIQRTRFPDRLDVAIDAAPDSLDVSVPAMLLQPLVENAVEHGEAGTDDRVHVAMRIARHGNRLRIAVENTGPTMGAPLPRSAFGHGLSNVDRRLEAAYGGDATLTVGPHPGGSGTQAVLDVPTHRRPDVRLSLEGAAP